MQSVPLNVQRMAGLAAASILSLAIVAGMFHFRSFDLEYCTLHRIFISDFCFIYGVSLSILPAIGLACILISRTT